MSRQDPPLRDVPPEQIQEQMRRLGLWLDDVLPPVDPDDGGASDG